MSSHNTKMFIKTFHQPPILSPIKFSSIPNTSSSANLHRANQHPRRSLRRRNRSNRPRSQTSRRPPPSSTSSSHPSSAAAAKQIRKVLRNLPLLPQPIRRIRDLEIRRSLRRNLPALFDRWTRFLIRRSSEESRIRSELGSARTEFHSCRLHQVSNFVL